MGRKLLPLTASLSSSTDIISPSALFLQEPHAGEKVEHKYAVPIVYTGHVCAGFSFLCFHVYAASSTPYMSMID